MTSHLERLVAQVTVTGPPRSKQRPRSRPGGGRLFTPRQTLQQEAIVRAAWESAGVADYDLEGRMKIDIQFFMPTKRKVDVDNLAKLVTDALNRIAYKDDSQIEDMRLRRYLDRDEPRTVISLYILEEQ